MKGHARDLVYLAPLAEAAFMRGPARLQFDWDDALGNKQRREAGLRLEKLRQVRRGCSGGAGGRGSLGKQAGKERTGERKGKGHVPQGKGEVIPHCASGGYAHSTKRSWVLPCCASALPTGGCPPTLAPQAEMRRRRTEGREGPKLNKKAVRMPGKDASSFD